MQLSVLSIGSMVDEPSAAPTPPTHVPERGGWSWRAEAVEPSMYPQLQTAMPMTIMYRRQHGEETEVPHLLVAESALLRRAKAPSGLGVYALRRLKGPREPTTSRVRRVEGDQIGYYGGRVVASAPTQWEADAASQALVAQDARYLLTLRLKGHPGWLVVDGSDLPMLPSLHCVNDPHGTTLLPRCVVNDYGLFRAARDIPALDWTRPLHNQVVSELSFDYGDGYWHVHASSSS